MHFDAITADYEGNLEDLVKKCSGNPVPMPIGRETVKKYAFVFKENSDLYLCVASQCTDPKLRHSDYNILISVQGPKKEKVDEIVNKIKSNIGVETKPAPEEVKKPFELAFKLHEQMRKYKPPFGFFPSGGINYN